MAQTFALPFGARPASTPSKDERIQLVAPPERAEPARESPVNVPSGLVADEFQFRSEM